MALLLLLLSTASALDLSRIRSEEATPSKRSYNSHTQLRQYLEETYPEVTTKQGPVLFPNDAPPPPRPPLIVTSRPLSESIARSELNPTPEYNNSIAESTQIKPEFRLRPEYARPELLRPKFLAKARDYKPFLLAATPTPLHYEQYADPQYNRYGDYEDHSSLPPIYKAIADAAKQRVLKLKVKKPLHHYDYQDREPEYARSYQHNDVRDDIDYDHNSNYAFSYTVKDHKTGDDFSHSQQSTGSATNGEYRVRLPDGRMQIVSYTADENGYKADVRYDDEDKTAGNSIDHYDYRDRNKHIYAPNRHDYNGNSQDYNGNRNDYNGNRHDLAAHRHDYNGNRHDLAANRQAYVTNKPVYAIRPDYHENRHDYAANSGDYSINRDHITKPPPVKEDYNQYTESKEYYNNNDYSSLEYDGKDDKYTPTQKSKYAAFIPNNSNLGTIVVQSFNPHNSVSSSTVRPLYEELKPLFVTKNLYNQQPNQEYVKNIEINVPSTTPSSINYDGTTEHVVLIGASKPTNLYTNIRNLVTATPTVTSTLGYGTVTPQSYLESSIASLKNGQKPVLSGRFIDKINKYLTFT
ncbi:hypothetical protein O0L34_g18926 [Tuta absoluta]|nr:hypothetical protein O0L34_g18926 [Tuta absoluta]